MRLEVMLLILYCASAKYLESYSNYSNPWVYYRESAQQNINYENKTIFELVWTGRTGNNFFEVRSCLQYSICCNAIMKISKPHPSFPLLPLEIDFSIRNAYENTNYVKPHNCSHGAKHDFFRDLETFPKPVCKYDEWSALRVYLFNDSLPKGIEYRQHKKVNDDECPDDMEDTLVIQIRSGDIFKPCPPDCTNHHVYWQPPLVYYTSIILSRNWKKVLFLTSVENKNQLNPIWIYFNDMVALKENFKSLFDTTKFVFQMSTELNEEMKLYMCARYFVNAHSTLSTFINYMNPYLKEFFIPWPIVNCNIHLENVVCTKFNLSLYINGSEPWKGTIEQKDKMLNYVSFEVQDQIFNTK
jgi:hypothetical protein